MRVVLVPLTSRAYHIHLAAREHQVWVGDTIPPREGIFGPGVDPVAVARPGFRRVPVQGHPQQAASFDLRRVRVHDWWAPGTRVVGRPACCGDND